MRREWTRGHVDTRATISRRAKGEGRGAQLTCANRAGGTAPRAQSMERIKHIYHLLAPETTREPPVL